MQLRHASWKNEYSDDVTRFVKAHENMYDTALTEILNGRKRSHWMWYIFPQLRGLGHTYNSNYYGIINIDEVEAFLSNEILNAHMNTLLNILMDSKECNATVIFGDLDALKLRSSMTLFDVARPNGIFNNVLDKFFEGKRDERTLELLQSQIYTEEKTLE